MSLLQSNSVHFLLKRGYFASSNFDLLEFIDENIDLSTVETAITDIALIVQLLSKNLPQVLEISKKIDDLQNNKQLLEKQSKAFSWSELISVSILVPPIVSCFIVSEGASVLVGIVCWIITLAITLIFYKREYKRSKLARSQLPALINNLNTSTSQLVFLKEEMLIDNVVDAQIVCTNLPILLNFLEKLKLVLSDQKISETERMLAIDHLFYRLQKQKNDKIALAATLAAAAYSKRQAEASERQAEAAEQQAYTARKQAEYTRQALDKQTDALTEQNRKLDEQTRVIKEKARLDEERKRDGFPAIFQ